MSAGDIGTGVHLTPALVLLVDGRSGSGKTRLAGRIARRIDAQMLHLDDLYPGWGGLAAGSLAVADALRVGRYRRYDWDLGGFDDEVALDPSRPIVVEGCGALTRQNLAAARVFAAAMPLAPASRTGAASGRDAGARTSARRTGSAVRGIWVACPEPTRRARALARDGEMFRPHWADWAEQEERHIARARPLALAAEIVHTG